MSPRGKNKYRGHVTVFTHAIIEGKKNTAKLASAGMQHSHNCITLIKLHHLDIITNY